MTVFPNGFGKDESPFIDPQPASAAVFLKLADKVTGLAILDGVDGSILDGTHSATEMASHIMVVFINLDA
jgi:hypothetical protein